MFEKDNLKNLDFTLLILVTLLVGFGTVMIGSADGWVFSRETFNLNDEGMKLMIKQLLGYGIGLVAIVLIVLLNYDVLKTLAIPAYVAVLGLLVLVLKIGVGVDSDGEDVRRWIQLPGGFTLQPSEYAKIGLILFFAWYLDKFQERINNVAVVAGALVLVGIPVILIMKEPSLSVSIVTVTIALSALFVARLGWRYIIPGVLIIGVAAFFIIQDAVSETPKFALTFLGNYQVNRIRAWLDPESYRLGLAFQTLTSKYAIGSGGLRGVGLFKGQDIPVATTDFIFGVIGEELGFVGACFVVLMIVLIVLKILWVARRAQDLFGKLLCTGVATMIAVQSAIHIGVTTALLPNTGLPLPFVSYGLSSLTGSMMGIGLVLKVHSETKKNKSRR